MNKSNELILTTPSNGHGVRNKIGIVSKPSNVRFEVDTSESSKKNENSEEKKEASKFTMIFNKCSTKLNLRPSKNQDNISKDKKGPKYAMIFNKDVTFRPKTNLSQPILSKTDLKADRKGNSNNANINLIQTPEMLDIPFKTMEPVLCPAKLNAETMMTLHGRSNFFKPELTTCDILVDNCENSESKKSFRQTNIETSDTNKKANDLGLRMHNSLTSLPKNNSNRRSDIFKNKIASLTFLDAHLPREIPKKHVTGNQEKKVVRVRSLDFTESISTSNCELERSLNFRKSNSGSDDGRVTKDGLDETQRKTDKKSRGDALRKGDKENGFRKQVQWKSEVDVIYFESHQAADEDRFGGILGRVMEPLREEWEQQKTGFYAKMVPLPMGSHLSERWQSLLKI